MAVGITLFAVTYHPEIDIQDTKLQYYVVSSYENGMITCNGNTTLLLDSEAVKLIDSEAFQREISKGERFFARVRSVDLLSGNNEVRVYGIMSDQAEYLSLDDLNVQYEQSVTDAALILVVSVLVTLLFVAIGIWLILAKKK